MDTIPELGRPQPKNLFIHLRTLGTTSWSWSEEQRLRVLFIGLSRLCRYTGWHLCITLYVRVHISDARRTESLSDSISPNTVCVWLLQQQTKVLWSPTVLNRGTCRWSRSLDLSVRTFLNGWIMFSMYTGSPLIMQPGRSGNTIYLNLIL